jgi:hypothetical protein
VSIRKSEASRILRAEGTKKCKLPGVREAVCKLRRQEKPEASARAKERCKSLETNQSPGCKFKADKDCCADAEGGYSMFLFLSGFFAGTFLMFIIISMLMVSKKAEEVSKIE